LVDISRSGPWGNYFETPGAGDRPTIIAQFALPGLPYNPSFLQLLLTLVGKVLGGWCAPEGCHGEVLLERVAPQAYAAYCTYLAQAGFRRNPPGLGWWRL